MAMRSISTLAGLFLCASLAAACGSDSTGGEATEEPMTGTVTTLGTKVSALEDHMNDHGAAISAAADLAAMMAEEGKHAEGLMTLHHELADVIDHMGMCMKGGAAPDTDSMVLALDDLGKEIEAHQLAMSKAADMKAASDEEGRHQVDVLMFVHDMHSQHEALSKVADGYMCPMSHAHM